MVQLLMNCLLLSRFRFVFLYTCINPTKFTSIHTIKFCSGKLQVLHRLDHSIHTMRLWANTKAKELCSEWNMNMFFRLINNDMSGICLDRLNEIRAPGRGKRTFLACTSDTFCIFFYHNNIHSRWFLLSDLKC